jgi:hypothetical protein
MDNQKIIVFILGSAIILGLIATAILIYLDKTQAATITAIVTTALGILSPSPVNHGKD